MQSLPLSISSFFSMYISFFSAIFPISDCIGYGRKWLLGYIQQPLVEPDVILIGGSLSEEVRHEALDNRSSSFKRLMDPSQVKQCFEVLLLDNVPNGRQGSMAPAWASQVLDFSQAYQCRRRLQIYKKSSSPQGLELLNSFE